MRTYSNTTPEIVSDDLPWPLSVMARRDALILIVAVLFGLIVCLWPTPAGTSHRAVLALGLSSATVILWATQAIPQWMSAAGFMSLALLTGTASVGAITAGFTSSAAWLVFGGLLTATATERTGFGRWIARKFLGRFHGSYTQLMFGILVGSTALSFLVPSNMGRIAITVPIVMALAKDAGYEPGTQGYIGLVITAVLGNFSTALAVLPANLLSVTIVGTGEAMYGVHITYMWWLVLCGPLLGLAKAVLVWWLVPRLYPAPPPAREQGTASASGPLSDDAIRVAVIQAVAILLWMTDFLHGIRPGWIAIAAGIACYLPGIGVLPLADIADRKRLLMVVWIAGVLSMSATVSETGAGTMLSDLLGSAAAIQGKSPTYGYFTLAYMMSVLTLVTTMGGAVPTLMALVGGVEKATGLPLETGMVALAAGSTALFLPYVAAPMVVGLTIANIDQRIAAKFTLWSAAISWVTIIPLNALWWRWLGAIP